MSIVDYSSEFDSSLLAIAKGKNFIRIEKLEERFTRLDGRRVSYQMLYCDLSVTAESIDDQAWACVRYSELQYWSAKELSEIGINVKSGKAVYDPVKVFDSILIL